jgi:hypothetical protein
MTITLGPCARTPYALRGRPTLLLEEHETPRPEEEATMYRPPLNSGTQRFEQTHRAPEREVAILRRQHREFVAAERARVRAERDTPTSGALRIKRPAAAIWSLVSLRR